MNNEQHPEFIRGTMAGMVVMGVLAFIIHMLSGAAFYWALGILIFVMWVGYAYETDKTKRTHTGKRKNDEE